MKKEWEVYLDEVTHWKQLFDQKDSQTLLELLEDKIKKAKQRIEFWSLFSKLRSSADVVKKANNEIANLLGSVKLNDGTSTETTDQALLRLVEVSDEEEKKKKLNKRKNKKQPPPSSVSLIKNQGHQHREDDDDIQPSGSFLKSHS